jgi:hypothetical protein
MQDGRGFPDLIQLVAVPVSNNAPGVPGQYAFDDTYFYPCIAFNTWARIALNRNPFPAINNFALQFNGSTQYVTLAGTPFNFNADFTVECWVKLSADNTNNIIFATSFDANNYAMLIARNDGNGLCFQSAVASGTATFLMGSSGTIASSEGWVHVALTRSGNNWTIYKNGVSFKTATNSGTSFATANPAIARLVLFSVFYTGYIDELRIWNYARTASQISDNMRQVLSSVEVGLTGFWRFEEGTGGTTADSSSGGHAGSLVASPTWSTTKPF